MPKIINKRFLNQNIYTTFLQKVIKKKVRDLDSALHLSKEVKAKISLNCT